MTIAVPSQKLSATVAKRAKETARARAAEVERPLAALSFR
jgi:hypothetical protein